MLHYNPVHVSSINMPIFRTNCITLFNTQNVTETRLAELY